MIVFGQHLIHRVSTHGILHHPNIHSYLPHAGIPNDVHAKLLEPKKQPIVSGLNDGDGDATTNIPGIFHSAFVCMTLCHRWLSCPPPFHSFRSNKPHPLRNDFLWWYFHGLLLSTQCNPNCQPFRLLSKHRMLSHCVPRASMMLLLPILDPSTSGIAGCQGQYEYNHTCRFITYNIQLRIRFHHQWWEVNYSCFLMSGIHRSTRGKYHVLLVEDDNVFFDDIVLSNIHRPILGNDTTLRVQYGSWNDNFESACLWEQPWQQLVPTCTYSNHDIRHYKERDFGNGIPMDISPRRSVSWQMTDFGPAVIRFLLAMWVVKEKEAGMAQHAWLEPRVTWMLHGSFDAGTPGLLALLVNCRLLIEWLNATYGVMILH